MRVCLLFVALVSLGGCGDDSTSARTQDLSMSMAVHDMVTVSSLCGHPGDPGNSKGVGKYCMTSSPDCNGVAASICSTVMPIPQGPTYFCTLPCDPNATTSPCGENASCTCINPNNPALCGCVPDVCRVGLFG